MAPFALRPPLLIVLVVWGAMPFPVELLVCVRRLTSVFVSKSFGLGVLEMPEPLVFVGVRFVASARSLSCLNNSESSPNRTWKTVLSWNSDACGLRSVPFDIISASNVQLKVGGSY